MAMPTTDRLSAIADEAVVVLLGAPSMTPHEAKAKQSDDEQGNVARLGVCNLALRSGYEPKRGIAAG